MGIGGTSLPCVWSFLNCHMRYISIIIISRTSTEHLLIRCMSHSLPLSIRKSSGGRGHLARIFTYKILACVHATNAWYVPSSSTLHRGQVDRLEMCLYTLYRFVGNTPVTIFHVVIFIFWGTEDFHTQFHSDLVPFEAALEEPPAKVVS